MIYLPKYYNPEVRESVERLSKFHDLVRLGDLVWACFVVSTGDEVGKLAYGTGSIRHPHQLLQTGKSRATPSTASVKLYESLAGG